MNSKLKDTAFQVQRHFVDFMLRRRTRWQKCPVKGCTKRTVLVSEKSFVHLCLSGVLRLGIRSRSEKCPSTGNPCCRKCPDERVRITTCPSNFNRETLYRVSFDGVRSTNWERCPSMGIHRSRCPATGNSSNHKWQKWHAGGPRHSAGPKTQNPKPKPWSL